jgi:hypothetical protein
MRTYQRFEDLLSIVERYILEMTSDCNLAHLTTPSFGSLPKPTTATLAITIFIAISLCLNDI